MFAIYVVTICSFYVIKNKEATFIKDVEGQGFDYSEIEEYADIIDDMVETSEELDDRLDDNRDSLLNFAKSAK